MSGVYIPSHIRAARRMTGFLLFLIGVALTVGLYYVKTRAQTARKQAVKLERQIACLLYTSPSPRDATLSRMPSSA